MAVCMCVCERERERDREKRERERETERLRERRWTALFDTTWDRDIQSLAFLTGGLIQNCF